MQTISPKTKKIFLTSLFVFVILSLCCFYIFYMISVKTSSYIEKRQKEVDLMAYTESVQRLDVLFKDTKNEREEVESFFLDVVRMAKLLEQIEQYAQSRGLSLESNQLRHVQNEDSLFISDVRIPYQVAGNVKEVYSFLNLLEAVPYHSSVEELKINLQSSGLNLATAEVVLVVSYIQYDKN